MTIYCIKDNDLLSFEVDYLSQVKYDITEPDKVAFLVVKNYQGYFIYTMHYKGIVDVKFYEKLTKKDMLEGLLGYPILPKYESIEIMEVRNGVIIEKD